VGVIVGVEEGEAVGVGVALAAARNTAATYPQSQPPAAPRVMVIDDPVARSVLVAALRTRLGLFISWFPSLVQFRLTLRFTRGLVSRGKAPTCSGPRRTWRMSKNVLSRSRAKPSLGGLGRDELHYGRVS
jgi:hypothetical protein